MQKLTSSAPIMQTVFTQVATYEKAQAYHMGFAMGRECSEDDRADGEQLTTVEEVWAFLKLNISPEVIARTHEVDNALELPHISFEQQVAFVIGYLSDRFAPQPAPVICHHKVIHVPFTDSTGFPLDA